MTQTIAHPADLNLTGPLAAVTAGSIHFSLAPVTIHLYAMGSVAAARAEFFDAAEFVLDTACTECGMDNRSAREQTCISCNEPGCDCEVTEHPHGGMFCTACAPTCTCADCEA